MFDKAPYSRLRRAELAGLSEVTLTAGEVTQILSDRQLVARTVERLKASLAFDQSESTRITRDVLDIETSTEEYNIEDDCEESYHAGRVEAASNAIDMLLGREVRLYCETETPV